MLDYPEKPKRKRKPPQPLLPIVLIAVGVMFIGMFFFGIFAYVGVPRESAVVSVEVAMPAEVSQSTFAPQVTTFALNPANDRVAVAKWNGAEAHITMSDALPGEMREQSASTVETAIMIDAGPITSVTYSPDGNHLLAASQAAGVVYAVRVGGLSEWAGHLAAFNNDGSWFAVAKANGNIEIIDTASRETLHTIPAQSHYIDALAISSDDLLAAAYQQDDRAVIRLWRVDAETAEEDRQYEVDQPVTALSFHPDGNALAVGGGDTLRVLLLEEGSTRLWSDFGPEAIQTVTFSPDGEWLVVGGSARTADGGLVVTRWDETGVLQPDPQWYAVHNIPVPGTVTATAFRNPNTSGAPTFIALDGSGSFAMWEDVPAAIDGQ